METALANVLRWGVLVSGLIIFTGGVIFLFRHGSEIPDYGVFQGRTSPLRTVVEIVKSMLSFRGRGFIQFGFLLLIATPVLRVLMSLLFFLRQRDWIYTVLTALVLALLLGSLFYG